MLLKSVGPIRNEKQKCLPESIQHTCPGTISIRQSQFDFVIAKEKKKKKKLNLYFKVSEKI